MKYKVTISAVTRWEEGNESAAEYSHGEPLSEIRHAMANEYHAKVETGAWQGRMESEGRLPFAWEGEADDEDEAVGLAMQELYEQLCGSDYYEPIECDYEIEEVEDGDSEDAEGD